MSLNCRTTINIIALYRTQNDKIIREFMFATLRYIIRPTKSRGEDRGGQGP